MLPKEEIKFENCLFRYRPINTNNISALENDRLYFSTPANFNDPYDNLVYANVVNIWGNVFYNLEYGMDDFIDKLKMRNPQAAFIGKHFWNNRRDELLEMQFGMICDAIDDVKKSIRKNVKIICLSEMYKSMLMWSHYAQNHEGFTLIFDIEELKNARRYDKEGKLTEKKMRLEKVEYVDKQIDLSDDIENYVRCNMLPTIGDVEQSKYDIPQTKLRKIVVQKSEEWKYEKEWRLIPRTIDMENESPLAYIECVPKGIILGAHCNKENTEKICKMAERKNIPVYRAYLNEFSPNFKLEIGLEEDVRII